MLLASPVSLLQQYFELHQLIEAHKRDFEALDALIGSAASEADRDRCELCLGRILKCWSGVMQGAMRGSSRAWLEWTSLACMPGHLILSDRAS